jgi:uncharacterized protein YndB with AHSA1/START domain
MKHPVPLTATKPSPREIVVRRTFDVSRALVFEAFTNPEMVRQWLWGPDEWPMVDCRIDLRVGGAYRYVWRHHEEGDMGMGGTFHEIVPPKRLVYTELFDEDWTGGETLVTAVFEEKDGRTTVTTNVRYSSEEARDGALKTGMLRGWGQAYDRLDDHLVQHMAKE